MYHKLITNPQNTLIRDSVSSFQKHLNEKSTSAFQCLHRNSFFNFISHATMTVIIYRTKIFQV